MSNSKLKVVITDLGYPSYQVEKDQLAGVDVELVLADCCTQAEVGQACKDADGVITRLAPVGAQAIGMMEKCRIISRYGVGVDNVDVPAATAKKIIVANVCNYCNEEVSDHALALLMACVRKISIRDRQVRAGMWDIGAKDPVYSTAEKILGLIGYGQIARTFHRKVSGLALGQVLVYDPFVPAEQIHKAGAKSVELIQLLEQSDYISIHAPLTESTHHLIGAQQFNAMKDTAILINTSRGPLVDPDALYQALKTGKINSAGIDVHDPEPPKADCKLFELDNIVLTDHAGWYSQESQLRLQGSAARNVAMVLAGKPPLFCVNPEVLSS